MKKATKQQKIVIDKSQLREVLKEAIDTALDFSWSGWRIPIYVEESGKVSAGEWLSSNSYQPGLIEIIGVEPWTIKWDQVADAFNYDSTEELTQDDKVAHIEFEVDELTAHYITDIQRAIETPEMHDPDVKTNELPIEIDDNLAGNGGNIAVHEDEDSDKIVKFISYNELRNDIKQMYESITGAFEDDEGDVVFVDDQNNHYK